MTMELPGIYLQTDKDELVVFDAVTANVLNRSANGVKIAISNPTKYDAIVSIFAETAVESLKPIGNTAFLKWPKVDIKSGEIKTIIISTDGKLEK